jgi:hypothetical protein
MVERADLVEAFAAARQVVEEAGLEPNSRLGEIAFDRAVTLLLDEPSPPPHAAEATPVPAAVSDGPVAVVAGWLERPPEKLLDICEFSSDGVEIQLWHAQLPERKADCQRLLAMVKLGLERVGFEHELVSARDLNALCTKYGCLDQNMPQNLQKYQNHIVRRGQRGAYNYRLTHAGLQAARETIRGLIDGR